MAGTNESSWRLRLRRRAARNRIRAERAGRALAQPAPQVLAPGALLPGPGGLQEMGHASTFGRVILETVSEGICCLDATGQTTFVNPAAARMTGWQAKDLLGKQQHQILHHSYADGTPYPIERCPIYLAIRDGLSHRSDDEVFWRKDGTSFPVSYTSTPIFIDGTLSGAVVNFQDISERIRDERWQRDKYKVFRGIAMQNPLNDLLQSLVEAYAEYDSGCCIAILLREENDSNSLRLVAHSGLPAELVSQLHTVAILSGPSACGDSAFTGEEVFVDVRHLQPEAVGYAEIAVSSIERCLILPMISSNGEVSGVAAFFRADDGVMSSSTNPFAPRLRGVRDVAQIAVETRSLRSSLIHQAKHDHLTGLPNRNLFEDRLNHAIRASSLNHLRVAVCLIDIDRFRRVNENFGHLVGDDLLQQLADRLRRAMRSIDTLARESGDEFLVLLPELGSASDAELICRRLLAAISAPIAVQGHSISVSANIGVSMYPEHAVTTELLIQNADTAVDYAKAKGQGKLQIFRPDLGERVRQLAAREAALFTALERNELYLMYQPLYDADRRIHGFEALLRWNSPELGLIPPDQFIPLAESTGLIIPIGEWVLNEACRQAASWRAESLKQTKIFVNISALQLGQADFTRTVSEALRISGLSPNRLELEVTESLIVPSFKKATARLQPLQNLGVSIAIDDFGTGHSSFGVLHKLPINAIKVDRSFVSRIDRDASGLSTVRAIVDLARQLGMKTVGEGVETEEQFALLHEMKCDYFQGYLLSRPLTPEAAQLLFEDVPALPGRDPGELRISA